MSQSYSGGLSIESAVLRQIPCWIYWLIENSWWDTSTHLKWCQRALKSQIWHVWETCNHWPVTSRCCKRPWIMICSEIDSVQSWLGYRHPLESSLCRLHWTVGWLKHLPWINSYNQGAIRTTRQSDNCSIIHFRQRYYGLSRAWCIAL